MRPFSYSRLAEEDIGGIWLSVARANPRAADRLQDALNRSLQMLAANPDAGRARKELPREYRHFQIGHYLVLFREHDNGIEVVRMLRASRQIADLFA
jgi:toxin ParE1/3/4